MPTSSRRWILIGVLAAGAALAGLALVRSHGSDERAREDAAKASTRSAPPPSRVRPPAPTTIAEEVQPWQTPPVSSAELPAGTVPTWRVDPPPPDPAQPMPAEPQEPPNPALERPSMESPDTILLER